MKGRTRGLAISVASVLLVAACASGPMNKRGRGATAGAALGAGTGAIIGSSRGDAFEGAVIGGAIGALTGGLVGDQMQAQEQTNADRDARLRAQEEELARQREEIERLKRY